MAVLTCRPGYFAFKSERRLRGIIASGAGDPSQAAVIDHGRASIATEPLAVPTDGSLLGSALQALRGQGLGQQAGDVHVHFDVQSLDPSSFASLLTKHQDVLSSVIQRAIGTGKLKLP